MSGHPITDVLSTTIQKIKEMVDVNTVVGDPITVANGTVIIPISKITLGFASGGSDIGSKNAKPLFGGGGGAGVTVSPVAFLTVSSTGDIRLLQLANGKNAIDHAVGLVPEMFDKITALFDKPKSNTEEDK